MSNIAIATAPSGAISIENSDTQVKIPIYRHKFSEKLLKIMDEFSRLHKFEDRVTFKESFNEWCMENCSIIDEENETLFRNGYTKDIKDKIFRSIRYYFLKKTKNIDGNRCSAINELQDESYDNAEEGKENKTPVANNKDNNNNRTRLPANIIKLMDEHIKSNIHDKPSMLFESFKLKYIDALNETEIQQLQQLQQKHFDLKLKKSFKNRCFKVKRNSN